MVAWGLGSLEKKIAMTVANLVERDFAGRIQSHDPLVWVDNPDTAELSDRLGWLDVLDEMESNVGDLVDFAESVRCEFDRIVLCGMGGSSLAPEVIADSFPARPGFPPLVVLDSTHPANVAAVLDGIDLRDVLFVISSKSGTTIETMSFFDHFWDLSGQGKQFVAITDPGTKLVSIGEENGFRRVFINRPDIGGRYSALSFFGLVPAALLGVDLGPLIQGAMRMRRCCLEEGDQSPGLWLGSVMGEAAAAGRDILTLLISPGLKSLGGWIEQLVAESTGKGGVGIVPVVDEPLGAPDSYGIDRLFVRIVLSGEEDDRAEEISGLVDAGHPLVEVEVKSVEDLGAQFFLWEFATAVAGAVMKLNPFDQPNVSESKANTNRVLQHGGEYTGGEPLTEQFFKDFKPGDFVAFLVYGRASEATDAAVSKARTSLRDQYRVATTAGYGPRYLHSTGQLHKGGAPVGRYVLIVDRSEPGVPVPGRDFSFGELIVAQAQGDAEALKARGLPVVVLDGVSALEQFYGV